MKFVLILLTTLLLCRNGLARYGFMRRLRDHDIQKLNLKTNEEEDPRKRWFTQILDHYDPMKLRTWKQRYFINDDYYKDGGPIFLLVDGEQASDSIWLEENVSLEMYLAKKYGAKVYSLEHRYYGMSRPTLNLSLDNLLYLSADQALADTANFITEMQSLENANHTNKWIMFGGSYGGSLVTWMRSKYSHLVYGAVANSAPLLAQIDFKDFYVKIQGVFENYSTNCVKTLANAFNTVDSYLLNATGRETLERLFKVCGTHFLTESNFFDKINFYQSVVDITIELISNDETTSVTLEKACDILEDPSLGEPVERLAFVNELLLKEKNEDCLELEKYDNTVSRLQKISWNDNIIWDRRWIYQVCTEFGWFATTSARPFNMSSSAIPVGMYKQLCTDVFGSRFKGILEQGVHRTNMMFGGLKIADVSNIIFIHGTHDPWNAAGITKTTNPRSPVILVEGGGHCPLIYPPNQSDSPNKAEAERKLEEIIQIWLTST